MIARGGSGWQTILADLSLILFMVAVAVVSGASSAGSDLPVQGDPVAYYAQTPAGPKLLEWLAEQQADSRQQLTVTVRYRAGGLTEALQNASALVRSEVASDRAMRLVIEPGEGGVSAVLAYDRPEGGPLQFPPESPLNEIVERNPE